MKGDTNPARWSDNNYKTQEGMGLGKPKEVRKEFQGKKKVAVKCSKTLRKIMLLVG